MSNSSKKNSIPTAAEFDGEIKRLLYLFQDKETDSTWESFDKALKDLSSWARLGAYEYQSFVPAIKALKTPIVNSLLTERTRLSGTASELTESLAIVLGRNFEPLNELFMPSLIKLCGRTNKVMVTRALHAVRAIISQSRVPRAIPRFCEPIIQVDPNKGLRSSMAECLLTSLKVNDVRELEPLIENLEKVIKSGAMDPAPEVRETVRKIYDLYKSKFEERVGSFVEILSADEKKYLKISGANKPIPRRPLPLRRQTSQQNMADIQDELSLSESDRSNSNLGGRATRVRTVPQENVGPILAPAAPVQPPRPSSSASRRPVPSTSEFSRALSNLENNAHSRSNTSNGTTDDPTSNSSETQSIDDAADSHSAASSVDDVATEAAALVAKHHANAQSINATIAQRAARQQQQALPPIDTAAATTTTDTASVASTPSSRLSTGRLLTTISSARKLEGGAILFGPNVSDSRPPVLNLFSSTPPSLGGSASTNVNTSTTTDYIDETMSESGSVFTKNSDPGQNSSTGLPTVNGRPVVHAIRVKAPIVATGAAVGGLLGRPARPIIKSQKAPASGTSGTVAPSIPSRSATAGGAQRVIKRAPTVTEKSADTSLDRPASATTRHPHALASTKARSATAPLPALVEKKSKDVIAAVEKRRKDAAEKKELDGDQHSENHKPKVIVERTTSIKRTVSSQPAITRKSSQPALDMSKRSVTSSVQRPTATTSRKATTTSTVNNPSATSTSAKPATSRSFVITKSRSTLQSAAKKSAAAGSGSKKASNAAVAVPAKSLSPTIVTSESAGEQLVDAETTIAVDENVVESIAVASAQQFTDDSAVDQPESADGSPLLLAGAIAGEQMDVDVGVAPEYFGEYVNRIGAGPGPVVV
ncbi:clasp N terminal-domain-containing protein [Endogone sp. FLAS-F59071]|nr:clasp N terminal-domain-containing protein [Endogone sp. FLAS-F59071]|eukprot:RUS21942.1 clasp N terminal-domain-containing protein [Endogone sp. FLAS-F59071]